MFVTGFERPNQAPLPCKFKGGWGGTSVPNAGAQAVLGKPGGSPGGSGAVGPRAGTSPVGLRDGTFYLRCFPRDCLLVAVPL